MSLPVLQSTSYQRMLINGPEKLAETHSPYLYLTERHMQAMWLEQKYFKQLKTDSGESIEILSPGIWNAEAGPDFLKAHIKIGSQEFRGDIELHLQSESWYQHQHHTDPRYNHLVLHIVFWKPKKAIPVVTSNGNEITNACLEPFLTVPEKRLIQLIDLDLYPYKHFVGSGQCAHLLFRKLDETQVNTFFLSAAAWRLKQKADYLETLSSDIEQQIQVGIARTLGYKNNAQAFIYLFQWLSSLKISNQELLVALGMRACGFFEKHYEQKWKDSPQYNHLKTLSQQFSDTPIYQLKLNQIRPFNHPIRRLVLLTKFITDPSPLYSRMIQLWNSQVGQLHSQKSLKQLYQNFLALFPTYEDVYWNHYYLFETTRQEKHLILMGEELKHEIFINVIMPFLHKQLTSENNPNKLETFYSFYSKIPASYNSKTKYLIHRFFGDSSKGAILHHASAEQGAYQLHHDFCLHYEASCEGCPFVERYQDQVH